MGENAPERVQEALEVLSRAFEGIVKGEGVRILLSGPLSELPSPGVAGRYYLASAEGVLLEDRGADWAVVATKDWGRLINKPDTFPPSPHVHDDRYFTETEADARFVNESDHTKAAHDALNINADTLDGLDSAAFALSDGTRLRAYRGTTAPANPGVGQIWEDTTTNPATLKHWNGSAWASPQTNALDASVTNAKVAAGAAIAEGKLALASDAAPGTASRRTLGTGAQQAAAGNDARLSDQRTPTDGSVTAAKMAADNKGVVICTSTTRPANPVEGQHIYETDTDATLKNTGTAQSPVWSALGGGGSGAPEVYRGSAAPATPHSYLLWIDTSTAPARIREWNGSTWSQHGHPVATSGADGFMPADFAASATAVCRVTRTTMESVPNNQGYTVSWEAVAEDPLSWFDATGRKLIVVSQAGLYLAVFVYQFAASTTGVRQPSITMGGETVLGKVLSPAADSSVRNESVAVRRLAAGDTISASVYQNSGAALGFGAAYAAPVPSLTVVRLK
jgi:hypothetical protein